MKISCPRPLDDGTIFGLPEGTQTPDLALRRRLLYSAELLEDASGNLSLFAVSKHYLVTWVGGYFYKRSAPPYTCALLLTELGTPYRL